MDGDWLEKRKSAERRSLPNLRASMAQAGGQQSERVKYSVSLSNLRARESFEMQFKPTAFFARWVHGFNHRVGVINLNNEGSTILFYAASNFGILYNWTTKKMQILQGHRHMVTCIASDIKGEWLVTGDTGPENIIIIWDSKDVYPVRTIFYPHGNVKLAKLTLSADAKYLLTLAYGAEGAQLYWWIWSTGSCFPHAKLEVKMLTRNSILAMEFNPINTQQFILMTKKEIWIAISEKIFVNERGLMKETDNYQLKIRCPEKKPSSDVGKLTCFCFVKNTQVLVGTNRGLVLVYAYTMQYKENSEPQNYQGLRFIKVLRTEKHRINVLKYVDNMVVTGNGKGEIHFFDDQMKLLYWVHGFQVDSVRILSFNIHPRHYVILDPKCRKKCPCVEKVVIQKDPETGLERQKLVKSVVPTDVTKRGLPFLIRDFIVCCYKTGIGFVDFAYENIDIILKFRISQALALTIHPEKTLICVGYMDGHLELRNYSTNTVQALKPLREYYKVVVPPKEDSIYGDYEIKIPKISVSCLNYSPSGLHLACGLNTGQLIFLDPTTIDIKTPTPFKDTSFAIKEIVYSQDSMTLAFSDLGKTVCVYKYDCNTFEWNFIGKHRAHYKDINSLLFLPAKNPNGDFKLLSFGADRIMAEYDVGASADECLELYSVDRVEQTAVPLVAIAWPGPKDLDPEEYHNHMTVLVANDEYKYKIINYETTMTLATYLGPRFDHPVKKMMLVTKPNENGDPTPYILFATKNIIGLQKLPLDGNPWKHVGLLGHPNQIITLCFRSDSGLLFTIGTKDNCVIQWKANARSVERTTRMGGVDLDPYYCLIENGRPGWLFQEIRDLFYYIQILCQGTFSPAMRRVKDFIPIDSLPDLMRALGFFPTEYEVENLLIEAKYQIYNKKPRLELDFEDFVMLYVNHRPAVLETNRKIKHAFKTFADSSKTDGEFMRRDDFVDVLCNYGECFSRELAWYLLSILSGQSFDDRAQGSEEDFSFLPSKIKLNDILTYILGIPEVDTMSEQHSDYGGGASVVSVAGEDDDNSSGDETIV